MNREHSWIVSTKTWLVLASLLYVVMWLLCPQEFIASDPWVYSQRAFEISQQLDFGSSDVFNHRLAVTIPVAIFYRIFGVNIITTNLWPLCAALLVTLTVWLALPDKRSKIIGVALCLTSAPLFKSSVALLPDIIATAFMALSSLVLFNRKRLIQGNRTWLLTPLAAVSLLFIAFLAKESAYWVLPLWALALFSDFKDKDRHILLRRFYLPVFGAGVFLGVMYIVFCYVNWGDPLARFKSIQALTGHHLWSWDKAPVMELVKRLTISPVYLFYSQYGITILMLAFMGLVIAPQSIRPWVYYLVFCLLSSVLLVWFH